MKLFLWQSSFKKHEMKMPCKSCQSFTAFYKLIDTEKGIYSILRQPQYEVGFLYEIVIKEKQITSWIGNLRIIPMLLPCLFLVVKLKLLHYFTEFWDSSHIRLLKRYIHVLYDV
jgi:hypothetical protein